MTHRLVTVLGLLAMVQSIAQDAPAPILIVGSNTPADAETLNAAIAASPKGSEIVLRGEFLLTAPLRLLSERSYRGESRSGTVLKQADGAHLPAVVASAGWLDDTAWTGTPVAIRHLTIDGNRANNPAAETAGLVLRSWLSTVEDIHIRNCSSDGLRLTSRSLNGKGMQTTQVNGRIAACFIERSGRHGINIEDPQNAVTDWIVCDNWIAGSAVDGLHLDNAAGWMIERNHIYGVGHHAIYAHRCFATTISNNYVEGFGETEEAGTWCGIRATLQGSTASTILGNRIFHFGDEKNPASVYRYLAVSVNYGTGMAVVAHNAIRGGKTSHGIGLHYAGSEGSVIVSNGNLVEGVAEAKVVDGAVTVAAGQ